MTNTIEIQDMSKKMFQTTVSHTKRCWNTCVSVLRAGNPHW